MGRPLMCYLFLGRFLFCYRWDGHFRAFYSLFVTCAVGGGTFPTHRSPHALHTFDLLCHLLHIRLSAPMIKREICFRFYIYFGSRNWINPASIFSILKTYRSPFPWDYRVGNSPKFTSLRAQSVPIVLLIRGSGRFSDPR